MNRGITILQQELGAAYASMVMEIAGGERLSVPLHFDNARSLRCRFGDVVAELLVDRFADSRFYVPRPEVSPPIDPMRVAELDDGKRTATDIARELRCSTRVIHKARARNRASRYVMGRTLGGKGSE